MPSQVAAGICTASGSAMRLPARDELDLPRPLTGTGLVEKVGTRKTGRQVLRGP
jgi:hypothetical protein